MFAKVFDRLVYALLGLIFGAIAAVILWILVHHERLGVGGSTVFDHGFVTWLKVIASTFAVVGFVAKDQVGSAIGGALDLTCKAVAGGRSDEAEMPTWIVVIVVAVLAVAVWHFAQA